MRCKITYTGDFGSATKRLAKQYRSLKSDLQKVNDDLLENPFQVLKFRKTYIRSASRLKVRTKEKAEGDELLTYVDVEVIRYEDVVDFFRLAIYDKSDLTTIKSHEISSMVKHVIKSQEEA